MASDVGIHDTLTYRFDGDGAGDCETASLGNPGDCLLDPAAATATVGVQVADDDLGVALGTVEVRQALMLCVNLATGALNGTGPAGACVAGRFALTLPAPYPVTLCKSVPTGGLRWSANSACSTGARPHVVPGDEPLPYCEHIWLQSLRIPQLPGQCHANELPGVIPG